MRLAKIAATVAIGVIWSAALQAAPIKLKPANPQPSNPKPGLSVRYAYPEDVKNLVDASAALKQKSKAGRPLAGLDHRDTNEGQKTLTSDRAMHVVARITGYVRFNAPGTYSIDFLSNDGVRAKINGKVVAEFNGRQPCEPTFGSEVEVPSAGWYDLDVLYFQRLGSACLHMRSAPAGKSPKWMPNSAFGH